MFEETINTKVNVLIYFNRKDCRSLLLNMRAMFIKSATNSVYKIGLKIKHLKLIVIKLRIFSRAASF